MVHSSGCTGTGLCQRGTALGGGAGLPIAQQQVEDVEAAVGARSAMVAAWTCVVLGGTRKEVCKRMCVCLCTRRSWSCFRSGVSWGRAVKPPPLCAPGCSWPCRSASGDAAAAAPTCSLIRTQNPMVAGGQGRIKQKASRGRRPGDAYAMDKLLQSSCWVEFPSVF